MDNAIYWIEYVIRHKGAPHLRPAVVDLYWYQSLMVDVILFYAIILITILYVMKLIIIIPCKLLKYLFKRKDKNQKKKKE
ncbi:hypothetical protein O3M35_011007 [Rhynocoris fuscipes]|uniref:Uncharacterized protein n=1 Tax=Rhynocoris fuscipes TaxID=488301 RepID=A0AAW1D163_9HEMI